jgi:hypothetical protein
MLQNTIEQRFTISNIEKVSCHLKELIKNYIKTSILYPI